MQKHLLLFLILLSSFISFGQKPELVIPSFHSASLSRLCFTKDGKLMITGGSDQVIKIWDYKKAKELRAFRTKSDITDIKISGNDQRAVVCDKDFIYVIDLNDIKILYSIDLSEQGRNVDISKDGQTIYYAYNDDKVQKVFKSDASGRNAKVIFQQAVKAYYVSVNGLFLSANEKFLLVKSRDDEYLLDLSNPAVKTKTYNGAKMFLPNNTILIKSGSAFSAIDPISTTIKWSKTINPISRSSKYSTVEKFLISPMDQTLSYSMVNGQNELLLYGDYSTGQFKEKRNIISEDKRLSQLAVVNGDLFKLTSSPYSCELLNLNSLVINKSFGEQLMMTRHMCVANDQFSFSFSSVFNRHVKNVSFKNNQTKPINLDTKGGMSFVKISDDGSVTIATNTLASTKVIRAFKNDQLIYTSSPYVLDDKFLDFGVSPDGRYLAALFFEKLVITDLQNKQVLMTETFPKEFRKYSKGTVAFHSDKVLISYDANIEVTGSFPDRTRLKCFNINSKSLLWTQTAPYEKLAFTPKGNIVALKSNQYFVTLASASGKELNSITLKEKAPYATGYDYNQSFSQIALTSENDIKVYNLKTGAIVTSLKGSTSKVWSLGFYNHEFLLSSGDDNSIQLWDVKNKRLLANLIFYSESKDWIVITPDGLFDGSDHAIKKMYYTKGKTFIPLDQLYEQFYTPGLLAQLISREIEPSPIEIDQIKEPPLISMEYKAGQRNLIVEDYANEDYLEVNKQEAIINIFAKTSRDKIREIRFYHNGKLAGNGNRGLIVEDEKPGEKEQRLSVLLLPGENNLKAIAVNSQGTESAPALLTLNYKAKEEASKSLTSSHGMTLHLVVVGIDKYRNPKYNLNYAYADADAFKASVTKGMKDITTSTNIHFVSNKEANKSGILNAFKSVQEQAKPQDIFVFYYAGHGVMSEGMGNNKKDFYLIPHDITQLYGVDEVLAKKGISATEMKELASSISAQKQLFVLDACQSAGAVESIAMRGAAEEKAIAQLARSTGTHWLTASGSEQYATEFDQLGHGVFTYALLEGLKGKADRGDNRVTINELKAYLESEVPELTQKYKGTPQFPSSYGYGQDFPITVIK